MDFDARRGSAGQLGAGIAAIRVNVAVVWPAQGLTGATSVTGRGSQPTSGMGQALAMLLPGIGSASAARHAGAPKGSAKYCVSCTTCP